MIGLAVWRRALAAACVGTLWVGGPVSARAPDAAAAPAAAPSAPDTPSFRFVDARPKDERKTKTLSLLIFNCNFGIVRVGEPPLGLLPSRLQNRLNEELGVRLAGREVVLDHELIWYNGNAQEAEMTMGLAAGPIGSAMAGGGASKAPRCAKEKMTGGWFDPAELTNRNAPFIVEIAVRIDGKAFSARAVYSPDFQLSGALINMGLFGSTKEGAAALAAVDKAVAALVVVIDTGLRDETQAGGAPPSP